MKESLSAGVGPRSSQTGGYGHPGCHSSGSPGICHRHCDNFQMKLRILHTPRYRFIRRQTLCAILSVTKNVLIENGDFTGRAISQRQAEAAAVQAADFEIVEKHESYKKITAPYLKAKQSGNASILRRKTNLSPPTGTPSKALFCINSSALVRFPQNFPQPPCASAIY